jgi:hypothetical protein
MFQFTNDWLGLPGHPYDGPEPGGFAHHSEVLERIECYGRLIDAPVREHTDVERVAPHLDGWQDAKALPGPRPVLVARALGLLNGRCRRARRADRRPLTAALIP